MVPVCWRSAEPTSLLDGRRPGRVAEYLVHRRGPLASNIGQAGAFVRSRPGLDAPDLQLVFAPVLLDGVRDERVVEPTEHGYSIGAILLQPGSRGRITLRSADPLARPVIAPDYLADPGDLATLVRGVRLALRIGAHRTARRGRPRPAHRLADADDDQVESGSIRTGVDTMFHPVGTCRMGPDRTGRRRWWTPRWPCTAWRGSGWPTRRSCRPLPGATPTRRRRRSPNAPPS